MVSNKIKNYTIVQANDLIRNKKDFSLWELRVFALLASHVKKEDDDFQTYRFRIKDLLNLFETKSNNLYEELKSIPEKLHSKIIKIPYEDDKGKKRLRRYSLISMSDVPDEKNFEEGEYIELRFDKDLKPLMLQLGAHFTVYKFYNILKLRSPYIFQLYELLKSEEYKGGKSVDLSLEDFIDILQIPKSYKYGNIKQRILTPAQKQFKKHTDIIFDFIALKGRGGKIVKLRFHIHPNSQISSLQSEEAKKQKIIKNNHLATSLSSRDLLYNEFEKVVVKDFGVTPSSFLKMLDKGPYTKETIEQAISVTRRAKYNQEIKKSVAGFFIKALNEGFTDIKIEQQKKQEDKKYLLEINKQLKQMENEYVQKKLQQITKLIKENQEEVSRNTIAHLKKNLNKTLMTHLAKLGLTIDTASIEDFRSDKILQNNFIRAIQVVYKEYFEELDKAYQKEKYHLQKQL